ncbi:MAG TPA: fructosamine kinase family protein [Longimicrobiales bacterium]|nr:fructosamine kinase family protein [Longimicrobiales bacterium]
MNLPQPLIDDVRSSAGVTVVDAASVGGGCISNATRVETDRGTLFLKWGNEHALFAAEADALRALGGVRVPSVYHLSDGDAEHPWLLLEWLEPGSISSSGWEALGNALAELHRRQRAENFGWHGDNFIGSLPQSNTRHSDWPTFWRDRRIVPQLYGVGLSERRRIEKLLEVIDELATAGNDEGASLLHGDLWSGNVHGLIDGTAALIDPSIYHGHREVDLAMADLFGGFDTRFWRAYEEAWPLLPGHEHRRSLYQLYYLLVHVNLFGGGYLSRTMSLVSRLGF